MADDNETEEVVYTKPTSQVDLEERLSNQDEEPGPLIKLVNPGYGEVEAGNLYLGTNPEYQNHANDTETPYQAEEGPDQLAEETALTAYDSRDVKEEAADLDEDETLEPQVGVSPVATVPGGLERGSPLVAESPATGEVPASEDEAVDPSPVEPSANFTGGTGEASPTETTDAPEAPDTPAVPTTPSNE